LLASCGGSPTPVQQAPNYAALQGNWYLFGQNSFASGDSTSASYIGLAIGVSGNTIYASGDASVNCSQPGSGIGGGISAIGEIAADGTFTLTDTSNTLNSIQYTIRGTVPLNGSATWQGTYSLFNSASTIGCTFNQSGEFTATAYAAFRGNYTGTLAGPHNGGPVVFQVSQGEPSFSFVGPFNSPVFSIPLSGTITVSGSPCFTSGTFTNTGSISGDSFNISISMNDGSTLRAFGWLADPSEGALKFEGTIENGLCSQQSLGGTLYLQP